MANPKVPTHPGASPHREVRSQARSQAGSQANDLALAESAASIERGDMLVVGTKVKELVKNAGCMSSADLLEAVSLKVHDMLLAAVARAKENNRTTVRPYDL